MLTTHTTVKRIESPRSQHFFEPSMLLIFTIAIHNWYSAIYLEILARLYDGIPVKIKSLSAGAVIVRHVDNEWRFLLLRCYRSWDFPKGAVEPGESPYQAALREVREETTLTDLEFKWGELFCETQPYGQKKVARYYLACSHGNPVSLLVNPELGKPEHHEFRWVNYQQALALLPPRLLPIIEWANQQIQID